MTKRIVTEEIEITPEMIKAGVALLMEWTDAIGDAPDRELVRKIYRAMARRRPHECRAAVLGAD